MAARNLPPSRFSAKPERRSLAARRPASSSSSVSGRRGISLPSSARANSQRLFTGRDRGYREWSGSQSAPQRFFERVP